MAAVYDIQPQNLQFCVVGGVHLPRQTPGIAEHSSAEAHFDLLTSISISMSGLLLNRQRGGTKAEAVERDPDMGLDRNLGLRAEVVESEAFQKAVPRLQCGATRSRFSSRSTSPELSRIQSWLREAASCARPDRAGQDRAPRNLPRHSIFMNETAEQTKSSQISADLHYDPQDQLVCMLRVLVHPNISEADLDRKLTLDCNDAETYRTGEKADKRENARRNSHKTTKRDCASMYIDVLS